MAKQVINNGTTAGDGTGENLFLAFGKVNANFTELYAIAVQATTTAIGLVELATNAEVIAGSDTIRAITPSGLTAWMANGQLAFPAAQNPSANANTLDDYEEGTWTPIVIGLGTAGAGTYAAQIGTYTKIGDRVFIDGFLTWSAHTGTGDMAIGTLPFAAVNPAPAAMSYNNLTFTAPPQAVIGPSVTTRVSLRQAATGAAVIDLVLDTAATISFAGHYKG